MGAIVMALIKTMSSEAVVNILISIAEVLVKKTDNKYDDKVVDELKKILNKK